MTRPYVTRGRWYDVKHAHSTHIHTTRDSAGMDYTATRCGHGGASVVRDPMVFERAYFTVKKRLPCTCCGYKHGGKWVLTDEGRKVLARRRLYAGGAA